MSRKNRKKLHELAIEKDIHYRGVLSYRHFRIMGWICMAVSQVSLLLGLAGSISSDAGTKLGLLPSILSWVGSLSLPLLLLASFAVILGSGNGFKKQLLTMGGAATAIIVLFELFFYRYFVGTIGHVIGDPKAAMDMVESVISDKSTSHFLSFNIFIDVVLCILFTFFLSYRPVRFFQGKKLGIFRALAAIPVLYEAASLILKIYSINGQITIPAALYPFLTTKPPIMFLVFVVLSFYIKTRERRFCKNGRTHLEYQEFLKTNRNSWQFSVFTAKILVIAGIMDFVLLMIFSIIRMVNSGVLEYLSQNEVAIEEMVVPVVEKLSLLGFGKSMILAPLAPVVLLFSYTKTYKNKLIDLLIPIGGVVLIIFVYLEAIYFGSGMLNF